MVTMAYWVSGSWDRLCLDSTTLVDGILRPSEANAVFGTIEILSAL